jgi:release factor glutamine methyltransferase
MPSIEEILENSAKKLQKTSDSALLDAEVLMCFVLKKTRSYLRAWSEKILTDEEYVAFQALLNQRFEGWPIAYLTGTREFWSREFYVNPNVLIPRAETELLIDCCLPLIANKADCKLLDLGTGSGVIGITLAAECPQASIIASDFSQSALHIAQKNAAVYALDNIEFQHSDWFLGLEKNEFDLIISNPPYIAENDPHLQQGDLRFEPQSALVSANKGLHAIEAIVTSAKPYLKQNGCLLIEHGFEQQNAVQAIFQASSYQNIETHRDLAGHPRVTSGQKIT